MFGLVFTKILTKTFIALSITLALVLVSNYDTSSEQIRLTSIDQALNRFNADESQELKHFDKSNEFVEDTLDQNLEIDVAEAKSTITTISKTGTASHYANKFHGRLTANGEIFNMYGYTCANKELPFGTIIKITNKKNNKSVLVKVNDRGPYVNDRIIDLSYKAAKQIDDLGLPKIKAEYIPKNYTFEESNQYIAYSTSNPINLYNENELDIVDNTDDFTTAVKLYQEEKSKSSINNVFIFVKAKNKHYKNNEYLIGKIKQEVLFAANN
ncbi:septal ring lytic transglycosylase RlpA family protein [Candidatus Kapabacteria bacterium]|nr:septal ring lytic transglycosylase RlpA family protein [Candidatus Kapabacteria bacterium]